MAWFDWQSKHRSRPLGGRGSLERVRGPDLVRVSLLNRSNSPGNGLDALAWDPHLRDFSVARGPPLITPTQVSAYRRWHTTTAAAVKEAQGTRHRAALLVGRPRKFYIEQEVLSAVRAQSRARADVVIEQTDQQPG